MAASNYAQSLGRLERVEEAKSLMRKTLPVARRVLGENDETTLRLTLNYAIVLCRDRAATLDDLREAVTILEDAERIARRVFGAHPVTAGIEEVLESVRAELSAELRGARA